MIRVFPAESRYHANHGWLQSYFSYSFDEYYDPNNLHFGPMRVLNDDIIQPQNGFGDHPHREMEIVTIVLEGQLQHRDSTGNTEILRPGEVQRMSAGRGIVHSETNPSDTEKVNLLQMWFLPNEAGLSPSYEQIAYKQSEMVNHLLPVVSNHSGKQIAHIHQDMTLYLCKLEEGQTISYQQEENRRIFFFVIEGEVSLNQQQTLNRRDSARITEVSKLEAKTNAGAFFMLIDLP